MTLKPLGDRVLIQLEEAEKKTSSGLYIPDNAQEKTQKGKIVAVGTDKDVITVSVGQKVMYDQYAGTKVKVDGVEYLIVKMSDVLAVLE